MLYRVFALLVSIMVAASAWYAFSPRSLPEFAKPAYSPKQLLMLDVTVTADVTLAVGEKGLIMRSTDQGKSWQAIVPAQDRGTTLTAVWLDTDNRFGIAVGHEGLILRTVDGGVTWDERHFDNERGSPLLAIAKTGDGTLWASGAFGRLMKSTNRGETWETLVIEAAPDAHFNAMIADQNNRILIAGEAGLLLVSDDGGERWTRLPDIYNGSYFSALVNPRTNQWLVLGMRGHIFYSNDFGMTWEQSELAINTALFGAAIAQNGDIYAVGQAGAVLRSRDDAKSFQLLETLGMRSFSGVDIINNTEILLAGESGLTPYRPAAQALKEQP